MVHRMIATPAVSPPNRPLRLPHSAVTPLACATGAPAGGRLNGGVRWHDHRPRS